MKLYKLLERLEYRFMGEAIDPEITELVFDTRKPMGPGSCFICIKGAVHDSHEYANKAAESGVSVIVAEHEVEAGNTPVVIVPDTRMALAKMSCAWFDYPAEKLITIGITGTKGKSTTSYMIKKILDAAGYKTGLIGTIESIMGDKRIPAVNTTPESFVVQQYFAEMVKAGCNAVVMEVSSQGLKLHRVGGFVFDYALFTNLEPDHIGGAEHADFAEYLECKSRLFRQCKLGVFNKDADHVDEILALSDCAVETYAMNNEADITSKDIELYSNNGVMGMSFKTQGAVETPVVVGIPGRFNISNALSAIAVCRHLVKDTSVFENALADVKVKGRLEPCDISDRFTLLIDYAHNAMALDNVLKTLREYKPGRLVCLFGCGGNRSRDRRFEMGEVSAKLADLTVVTSDNPRFEKPEDILADIMVGVRKGLNGENEEGRVVLIPDRREAIRYCIENAKDGDVIILAGKGHEDYQEIEEKKYPMDERIIVAEIVDSLGGRV